MFLTTLCYIEKDDCYLMLHRVKKENDLNHDKWIGVGGKFEADMMAGYFRKVLLSKERLTSRQHFVR